MKPFTKMLIHVKHLEESLACSKYMLSILQLTLSNLPPFTFHSLIYFFSLQFPSQEMGPPSVKNDITQVPFPASFGLGPAKWKKKASGNQKVGRER